MIATRLKTISLAVLLLAGCAAQDESRSTQDANQAVRDYIEVRRLQQLASARAGNHDHWRKVADHFIVYTGRGEAYLFETTRRCAGLRADATYSAEKRWELGRIRAGFDKISDCTIATIYALSVEDVAELENIGTAPGEHF